MYINYRQLNSIIKITNIYYYKLAKFKIKLAIYKSFQKLI